MTLQIFERFEPPGQDPFYRVGGSFVPYCTVAKDKRFTDAELAAEYWLLSSRRERMLGYRDGKGSETENQAHLGLERMDIVLRFAILPHFDEVEE